MYTPSHGYVIVKRSRVGNEVECDVVVVATGIVIEDLPVHYLVGAWAREGYINDRRKRPSLEGRVTSDVVGPESKTCGKGFKSFSFTIIYTRAPVRGLSIKVTSNQESFILSFPLSYSLVKTIQESLKGLQAVRSRVAVGGPVAAECSNNSLIGAMQSPGQNQIPPPQCPQW